MKSLSAKSALRARDPMDGGASRVAVFVPAPRIACALGAALLLSACGGAAPGTTAADTDPIATVQSASTETTPTSSTANDSATSSEAPTSAPVTSAASNAPDVLLIQPAGRTELPQQTVPAVRFKSLASPAAELSPAAAVGRAATRAPVVADGGRSTTVNAAETTQTNTVTISWDPPIENADGSSLNDLAGYRVYQGNQEQLTIVQELNETGAGERRLTQIPNVSSANSCFAVTAYDTSANESALGDVVCKTISATPPPTNTLAPALTSVSQLSSNDGQAQIQLVWQPPSTSSAAAGSSVGQYSIYHGNQSQLFKIQEVSDAATRTGSTRTHVVSGIGGEQACFALTARYTDGTETSLGEIVCVALVHSAPPQPGTELRPYNVVVDMIAANTARVSWDKPNTVVSSADATGIDRYDLYQGSRSQVYKLNEINETGAAGTRRSTIVESVFEGSHCFALTATDESRRQSALSTIVCGVITAAGPTPEPPPSGTIGVTNVTAQETSPGSVALSWDAPELVAAGQPIANLRGYNVYQGSDTQLFKVTEVAHNPSTTRQQVQRTEVDSNNACFAVTAYDSNGFEAPLSGIVCATISGTPSVPQYGIVPPTELATSALGGSTTVTLTWLASGAAATGAADPNVNRYNIYQGNHDRLFKVRQVKEEHDADPRSSTTFTGVTPDSACFAITAQYRDLRESRLSEIVCRDD